MAKVPLNNVSPLYYMKTIEEASSAVSKWPEWKRKRQLFSTDEIREFSDNKEKPEVGVRSASA